MGDAGSVREALVRIPLVRPHVAVLDVRLPDGNGVELCRDLRALMPDLACLMLTSFAEDQALLDTVLAGAAGYVLKNIRGGDLVGAVRTVATGGLLLDPHATSIVLARLRAPSTPDVLTQLSAHERKVLVHIGDGLTNQEISIAMSLTEKTIRNHVSNVLSRLGHQRPAQAAVLPTERRQTTL